MKLSYYLVIGWMLMSMHVTAQITKIEYVVDEKNENSKHDHSHDGHDDFYETYGVVFGQSHLYKEYLVGFDEQAAKDAYDPANQESPIADYLESMRIDYLIEKFPEKFVKRKKYDITVPMKNANCPNVGFDNLTFNPEWTGGISSYPAAFTNNTIVTNGINSAYNEQFSRHTILTTPPINNNQLYGAIVGYDPIAINQTTGLAEIPFVAPGGNGASVRLGNAYVTNNSSTAQKERLRYVINVTNDIRAFYYQFAVIFENPSNTHTATQQPYLKIRFLDSNENLIGVSGCGEYDVNSSAAASDPTYSLGIASSSLRYYRKWDRVDVDLTPYVGQQIIAEFITADCSLGGHFGYAYIDAGCQESLDTKVNFCQGDVIAELVAPPGFVSYQWFGPNNDTIPISGATNDTLIINNPSLADTFYVQITTANGCDLIQEVHMEYSVLEIDNIVTEGTCFGANIGSVEVTAFGSPQGYLFDFQPINVQQTNGDLDSLYAGTYMLHVSSPNPLCGTVDTTFTITVPQVYPSNVVARYCEGIGEVIAPQSNDYQWYDNNQNPISPPIGTSQIIVDSTAYAGEKYYLKYQLPSGCYDSLIYTFYDNKVGSSAIITRPSGCRSVNIQFDDFSPSSDTLTFSINGPNGYQVIWNDTAFTAFQTNGLDTGTYHVLFIDEGCHYDTTFSVTDVVSDTSYYVVFCPADPKYNMSSLAVGAHQWTDPLGNVIGNLSSKLVEDVIEGAYIDSCQVIPGCYALTTYNMDSITIVTDYSVDDNICNGGSEGVIYMEYVDGPPGNTIFTATGEDGSTYQGDTLSGLPAGTYVVQTTVLTCVHTDTILVGEPDIDGDTLTIYAQICDELETVILQGPEGYSDYKWYYKGKHVEDAYGPSLPISYPDALSHYQVTYSVPPLGCTKRTLKFDTEQYHYPFKPTKIANVFTPNADDINGIYRPFVDASWDEEKIADITRSYKMTVFNRWGNKIFESSDYADGWDGKTQDGSPVADGVYFVQIEYVQQCESDDYMFKVVQEVQVVR